MQMVEEELEKDERTTPAVGEQTRTQASMGMIDGKMELGHKVEERREVL